MFCRAFADCVLYRWWVCRERNSYMCGVAGLGSLAAVVRCVRCDLVLDARVALDVMSLGLLHGM